MPLEVISHIMANFNALWAKAPDSRAACAAFIVQNAEAIMRLIKRRLPSIVLTEKYRSRGRIAFDVRAYSELVGIDNE